MRRFLSYTSSISESTVSNSDSLKRPTSNYLKNCNILLSLLVRLVFILECGFLIYYTVGITASNQFYYLSFGLGLIFADGIFATLKRDGYEYTWFSLSTFCYSCIFIAGIWEITYVKYAYPGHECPQDLEAWEIEDGNSTFVIGNYNLNETLNKFWMNKYISECQMLEVVVAIFLISLVLARWLLPAKDKLSKSAISEMLINFVLIGSDIAQFFGNIELESNTISYNWANIALSVFTLSIFQFSFTPTIQRSSRDPTKKPKLSCLENQHFEAIFGSTVWSYLLILVTHHVPFFIVRLVIILKYYRHSKYTLYFFCVKDLVEIYIIVYRIVILVFKKRKDFQKTEKKSSVQK